MLGTDKNVSVRDIITHVEQGDDFGRKIVRAQINMLKVLTEVPAE